jgi:GT2 family glycosyltransferase
LAAGADSASGRLQEMVLSIIIINWNSRAFLRECLRSLAATASNLECEILVIDNASHDGSAQMVAEEFRHATFIQSESNLGFSGGNNRAAQQAKGDFLLFLNPDTVVERDALVKLVQALRRLPDAGIVGARLLNTDLTLQTSCIQSFPTVLNQVLDCDLLRGWFPLSPLWGMAALFNNSTEPTPVEGISGACLMIKRELFDRLGGFHERYFMYSEDIDLGFRIHQAGFKCYYVPGAKVVHHGGGSSQQAHGAFSSVMIRESVYRFMRLHRGRFKAACFRFAMGLSALFRLTVVIIMRVFCRPGAIASGRVNKWLCILRWSLGMEPWAAKQ